MRKLLAAVTALSLFALSMPMQASAQGTNPPVAKTEPAAKTKTVTSTSTTSKHHAKRHLRHHRRHVAKRHRLNGSAAYSAHRKQFAAKKQHQTRHHRGHRHHVVRPS
jgi:hypothetical protein